MVSTVQCLLMKCCWWEVYSTSLLVLFEFLSEVLLIFDWFSSSYCCFSSSSNIHQLLKSKLLHLICLKCCPTYFLLKAAILSWIWHLVLMVREWDDKRAAVGWGGPVKDKCFYHSVNITGKHSLIFINYWLMWFCYSYYLPVCASFQLPYSLYDVFKSTEQTTKNKY